MNYTKINKNVEIITKYFYLSEKLKKLIYTLHKHKKWEPVGVWVAEKYRRIKEIENLDLSHIENEDI